MTHEQIKAYNWSVKDFKARMVNPYSETVTFKDRITRPNAAYSNFERHADANEFPTNALPGEYPGSAFGEIQEQYWDCDQWQNIVCKKEKIRYKVYGFAFRQFLPFLGQLKNIDVPQSAPESKEKTVEQAPDADELWDKYSQYIGDRVSDLEDVAGTSIIKERDFKECIRKELATLNHTIAELKRQVEVYKKFSTANEFGNKIKAVRTERGKTLRQIENATGISNAYLSQLENGKINNPSLATVNKIMDFLFEGKSLSKDDMFIKGNLIK